MLYKSTPKLPKWGVLRAAVCCIVLLACSKQSRPKANAPGPWLDGRGPLAWTAAPPVGAPADEPSESKSDHPRSGGHRAPASMPEPSEPASPPATTAPAAMPEPPEPAAPPADAALAPPPAAAAPAAPPAAAAPAAPPAAAALTASPASTAPSAPAATAATKRSAVVSNVWFERQPQIGPPTFEPVDYLMPGSTYTAFLDLSGIPYSPISPAERGVATSVSTAEVGPLVSEALEGLSPTETNLTLTAYMVRSPRCFDILSTSAPLNVNLKAYRSWNANPSPAPADAMVDLRRRERSPYVFGRVPLRLKPRADSPEGLTSVAILLWNGDRPVDERVITVCIAKGNPNQVCAPGPQAVNKFPGDPIVSQVDSVDASLQIIELPAEEGVDTPRMFALFKQRGKMGLSWPLGKPMAALQQTFAKELPQALDKAMYADSTRALVHLGEGIRKLIFPEGPNEAAQALLALEQIAQAHSASDPPKLLLRIVPYAATAPLALPFALLTITSPDGHPTPLGQLFKVKLPLPRPVRLSSTTPCLDQWVLALPPITTHDYALTGALKAAQLATKAGESLTATGLNRSLLRRQRLLEGFDQLRDFATEREIPTKPSIFLILSHHANGGLWFDSQDTLTWPEWSRKFKSPSVAILNGCGTGQTDASSLIPYLNKSGVAALIASTTMAEGGLAGDFMDCLLLNASDPSEQPRTLEDLHFRTLQCLAERKRNTFTENPSAVKGDLRYGARALTYMLLGNGSIPICRLK